MKPFELSMTKREKVSGWIYLPIHIILMPLLVVPGMQIAFMLAGMDVSIILLNAFYYGFGFLYILFLMGNYLKENFTRRWNSGWFGVIFAAFLMNIAINLVVNLALQQVTGTAINPNQEAVNDSVSTSVRGMFAIAVLMGPLVEEVLFRGVVFGTIREKNRVLAYIVSALLFAAYHLWQSVVISGDWTILIYMLQYIPIGLILAWTYERCNSIWASILLHMMINALAVSASAQL